MSAVQGRAFKARPLACLLAVAAALGALASPAAAAPPKAPGLLGTNPPSPSTETRPAVLGDGDGVITSVTRSLRTASLSPTPRALHPNYTITVYANDQTCTNAGAVVGHGTAAELEGAGVPLEVDLEEDAETALYATQTDPAFPGEPSECSNPIVYQQVGSAPDAPTFSATVPASPADDNTPALIGQATAHSTVSIYTSPDCSGSAVATGTAAKFAGSGIEAPVLDNTTTTFYAKAELATLSSPCSTSSITYQEVSAEEPPVEEPPAEPPHEEPPAGGGGTGGGGTGGHESPREPRRDPPGRPAPPKLRTTPEGIANDNSPTVTGRAPGAWRVQVFDSAGCRGAPLASGSVPQFDSGIPVRVTDNSSVALYGVSIDGGGDHSVCSPEPVVYVEDSTAPHVRITSGPARRTRRRTVQFSFLDASGDPSTSYLCRLDRRKWLPCQSPLRLRHLGLRRHTLVIRGADAAGNVEKTGARRTFRVIHAAP